MTTNDRLRVWNLWAQRVKEGKYLADVPPYNLTEEARADLIIDALYVDAPQMAISPFYLERMYLVGSHICEPLREMIERHKKATR